MKPMIPWMGGKRRLAKYILPLLPEHRTYVEPFCGGAAIFFLKPQAPVEVLNDRDGDLVNLYRVVKYHLEEFIRHFKWALISRQEFLWAKQVLPETLTDIQRAARFYYLQKLCFGAKPHGRTFGTAATSPPKLNLLRIEKDLSSAHLRLTRVCIEKLDWAECMRRYDRDATLFFLDPPYWGTEGYGEEFSLEEYQHMAELAKSCNGKVLITVNDHSDMRATFDGLEMDQVGIHYTVGGGRKQAHELLIRNYEKPPSPPFQKVRPTYK